MPHHRNDLLRLKATIFSVRPSGRRLLKRPVVRAHRPSTPARAPLLVHRRMELTQTVSTAGGSVILRPLRADDRENGIFALLAQLTESPPLDAASFEEALAAFDANPNHLVVVAEDKEHSGKLLGTAAVLVEQKLLRGGGRVGHIEDLVVDASARGRSIGKLLVNFLVEFSKDRGCYKVILDCGEHNVPFYEKCGLENKGIQMAQYFD